MELQQIYYLQSCYLQNYATQKYTIIIMTAQAEDQQQGCRCWERAFIIGKHYA